MFLTAYNLPHYLLATGNIDPASIVDGDFILAEAGRRNRNFKVIRRKQPGLFVKQIKTNESQAMVTIQREAAFYQAVHSDPRYSALSAMIPKFVHHDPSRHALILSLTESAESLSERHTRLGWFPEDTASLLGSALGAAHLQGAAMTTDARLRPIFTGQLPWPITLDQTGLSLLDSFGPTGQQLSKGLTQLPHLASLLGAVRPEWRYDSLIHNDMKWDNCLVTQPPGSPPAITIVDWELADFGDGAWDVGTIFKEYLVATILNASAREAAMAQRMPPPAEQSIASLQPSIRAFWLAYAQARGLAGMEAMAYLQRAVKLTAGRMVIAVLEYLSGGPQYGALMMRMLQASVDILQAPQLAAAQMVGYPVN